MDKYREENDELKFQLEERNIELEGTRAQVRILEKLNYQSKLQSHSNQPETSKKEENFPFLENDLLKSKGFSETEINRAMEIFLNGQHKKPNKEDSKISVKSGASLEQREFTGNFELSKTNSNVIPVLALPMPVMSSNISSGAESNQALEISSELEADVARVGKNENSKNDKSPYRRRPSRIPLNIQKSPKTLLNNKKGNPSLGNLAVKKTNGDVVHSKDGNTTTLTMTFKKTSLVENSHDSMNSSRSPQRTTATSAKNNSISRINSQPSITPQKFQTAGRMDKKKSMSSSSKEDSSLSSNNFSSKNLPLKQTTNFSNIRQRDTLTRKNHSENGDYPKKTLRGTLRESFRTKSCSEASSSSSKRDNLPSRKESIQQKHCRTVSPSTQQKSGKSMLVNDVDVTKVRPTKLSFWSNWLKILDTNNTS